MVYSKLYGGEPYKGKHRRSPERIQRGEVYAPQAGGTPYREQSRPGWRHAELPKARHAEEGLVLKYVAHSIHSLFRQQAGLEFLQPVQVLFFKGRVQDSYV
jgi:hypothetical protein